MCFAVKAREVLLSKHQLKSRVVSFPSQRLFEQQPREYRSSVLQFSRSIPRIVIEAYAATGWERYDHAGYSMSSFGHSLPGAAAYRYFGYDENVIASRVADFVEDVQKQGVHSLGGEFFDLNNTTH